MPNSPKPISAGTKAKLVKQVEFYLSDANLRRDLFFKDLLSKDEFVPLDVFLNCKRIKQITSNIEDLKESLKQSENLQINEESSSVKRNEPVDFEKLDSAPPLPSVFVAHLAASATLDGVRKTFQEFGDVVYTDVRRLEDSSKFAIVEFEDKESVDKAVEKFPTLDWASFVKGSSKNKVSVLSGDEFAKLRDEAIKEHGLKDGVVLRVAWKHILKGGVTEEEIKTSIGEIETVSILIREENCDALVEFKDKETCSKVHQSFINRKALLKEKVVKAFHVPLVDQMRQKAAVQSAKREREEKETPETDKKAKIES